MPTKNYFFYKVFPLITLFEGTFTSFFKDKKSKRSHKAVGIKVFLTTFAGDRRIRNREPDPDPYPLTNGSGSGSRRPQNIWIRIRNTDLKKNLVTLRSKWTIFLVCRYWTPRQICLRKRQQSDSVRVKSSVATRSNNSPPSRYSMTKITVFTTGCRPPLPPFL